MEAIFCFSLSSRASRMPFTAITTEVSVGIHTNKLSPLFALVFLHSLLTVHTHSIILWFTCIIITLIIHSMIFSTSTLFQNREWCLWYCQAWKYFILFYLQHKWKEISRSKTEIVHRYINIFFPRIFMRILSKNKNIFLQRIERSGIWGI